MGRVIKTAGRGGRPTVPGGGPIFPPPAVRLRRRTQYLLPRRTDDDVLLSTPASKQPGAALNRRGFLAGATAAGFTMIKPELVFGTQANSKVTLGLIGCGGRGNWIANLFVQHGGYQFVAAADYFGDRADAWASNSTSPAETLHRPVRLQAAAGRQARRDRDREPAVLPSRAGPGRRGRRQPRLLCQADRRRRARLPDHRRGRPARRRRTRSCVLVDFQTRADEFYHEAIRRVHAGDIGPWSPAKRSTTAARLGRREAPGRRPQERENRLRAWGLDRVLSGDVITEQNIHALDVATWFVDQHPLKAYGTCGGRAASTRATATTTFAVMFTFPDNVLVSFASKQYGTGYDDIGSRMFGPEGTLDTHYFGQVIIRGEKSYKGGKHRHLYHRRRGEEHRRFPRRHRQGRLLEPDRGPQRAEQPDHDPRPHRRLQERGSHLGRDAGRQREA